MTEYSLLLEISLALFGYAVVGGITAGFANYYVDLSELSTKEIHIVSFIILVWPLFWILTLYGILQTGWDYAFNN